MKKRFITVEEYYHADDKPDNVFFIGQKVKKIIYDPFEMDVKYMIRTEETSYGNKLPQTQLEVREE